MLHGQDTTRLWRHRFHDATIAFQTHAEAESLLDDLHPERPLRLRLSKELEVGRSLQQERGLKRSRDFAIGGRCDS